MRITTSVPAAVLVIAGLAAPSQPAATAASSAPTCKGRAVTILGTDGADHLRGTNHRDVILALAGDDRIDGRGGNDVICGGSGRDLILGGSGADKIFGGADGRSGQHSDDGSPLMAGDVVQGGPGDDLIDLGYDERQQTFGSALRDRLSYADSRFRVILTLGSPKGRGHAQGDGRDLLVSHPFLTVLGSDKDDVITGSPAGDEILGRGGADQIDGGAGRDVLVDGPKGARVGDDVLVGGVGRDSLTSYGGHDRLVGNASADAITVLHAPRGEVTLEGGPGADTLNVTGLAPGSCVRAAGGDGLDSMVPSVAASARDGKVEVDLKRGTFGVRVRNAACGRVSSVEDLTMVSPIGVTTGPRWIVHGTGADETVVLRDAGASLFASMAAGDDRVTGSSGDDNLRGGPGDDRLFGGAGHDVANGGPGTDTCRKVEFRKGCEIPG